MADDEEVATQAWIEAVTGKTFDGSLSFQQNLKSGVLLCELMNTIRPGGIKKINTGSFAFKQIDNIGMFLRGAQALGMPRADCFSANDL